ncbi:MAG: CoA transferase [Gammaproteobacteria bacterium]|nr:CoA transferase [Gammaproteobacteria bacterium]MBP6050334.1 CoA transferase [Pseudomonadales bacterium]MBK6583747.1 CoA transferase [Gammaproteobacteria bacterium]MBK7170983.1 CoA transferase [Gammaproteobacteria bacterium]MBK7522086.1 CoA transferase [Gammaproteobacteria bacterium]
MKQSALGGRRVLEIADATGVYCGKLLADLGAEVIRLEPPGGDATRRIAPFPAGAGTDDPGFFHCYMNAGKKSLTLDPDTAAGRSLLLDLAATADLIVETLPPGRLAQLGLGFEQLRAVNPALVLTSITPFGQSGPHRDYPGADIVAMAMGGAMVVTGDPADPPVTLAGSQACVAGATLAAVSSLIALRHAACTGQGQHVDISMQEAMLAVTSICGASKWLDDGLVPKRFGTATFSSVPSGIHRCSDGEIYLMVNRPLHWKALARWVHETTGNEEILDPMFEGSSLLRQPYRELLDIFIGEHTARFTVEQLYREGQRRHLALTPLNSVSMVCHDRHLAERGFFVEAPQPAGRCWRAPGAPYRLSRTPCRVGGGAPQPGEHDGELAALLARRPPARSAAVSAELPLAGVRVVEFTAGMAGPWIGRFMAWCGADVIKVESKAYPDVTRLYIPPREPQLGIQPQCSPWFTDWNAGKRFVSLDLTTAAGSALARRLIGASDVVIDNNSSGVLAKLGLGFDELERLHPEMILFSSTGYGDSGPDHHYVSWGPNIETLSGLASVSGFPGRDCTMTQFAYPDPLSALHGLCAILAALEHRREHGAGQRIDLSQLETMIASFGHLVLETLVDGREPRRLGNGSLSHAPQGCYPCRGEDRWCVIAVADEAEWQRFCTLLGRPHWIGDARFADAGARRVNAAELDRLIGEWTSARDPYEVMHLLAQAGIAAGVVQDVEDQLQRDGHLAARAFFEEISHHRKGTVVAPGIPLGLTGTQGRTRDAGHARGHDNREVFCELLGLSSEEFANYLEGGVIEAADA